MTMHFRIVKVAAGLLFLTIASYAAASTGYFAACTESHGISGGWNGPTRTTYVAAEKDAEAHKKVWRGHSVGVTSSQ
jgi:hypothetical protein